MRNSNNPLISLLTMLSGIILTAIIFYLGQSIPEMKEIKEIYLLKSPEWFWGDLKMEVFYPRRIDIVLISFPIFIFLEARGRKKNLGNINEEILKIVCRIKLAASFLLTVAFNWAGGLAAVIIGNLILDIIMMTAIFEHKENLNIKNIFVVLCLKGLVGTILGACLESGIAFALFAGLASIFLLILLFLLLFLIVPWRSRKDRNCF